jgi:glycosyl transferase family 25
MSHINSISDITHAFYINLEHRKDRKKHVESELTNIGINATRFNAIKMNNGAVGCSMSHLKLLQLADTNKYDHILIVEDDIKFLDPELFKTQLNTFFQLRQNNWDVILIAGNNMPPYKNIDETCIQVTKCQTTTGYIVNGHYISTLIQNIKTGLTNLLNNPTDRFTYAIDKYWFRLQEVDKWFFIIPPTVVQREDYSDIEKCVTNFEKHMLDIDKEALIKAFEARQRQQQQFQQLQQILNKPKC